MERTCAASAMEWSIELEKGLRSKKPGGCVDAILKIGPWLQQWSREPESNMATNSMFGLVVGEDKLFANTILLRLADAFVFGDKKARFSIVKVFLSELKHRDKMKPKLYNGLLSKARVLNHLELLKRVKSVFNGGDEESRAFALVLFGCWADFAQENAQIRYLILSSLVSPHAGVVKASLFAAGCFCKISDDFACITLEMLVNMVTSSEISLPVKLDAARVFAKFRCSYSVANKAYKTGRDLVLNASDEEFFVAMLISLSGLASISTILSSEQVGLLLSFLNQERSSHIRETALRCLKFLVTRGQCNYPVNSDLIHGLFCMLEEPEVSIAIQCEVLQVLHKVHLCFPPSLPYMEVHEFVKLLTVAENAIQDTDLMKSHLAIHILADLSCRFLGGTGNENSIFCSSLPSRVISLIKDQIKLLLMPLLEACQNHSKLFQDLQSLLKILLSIVGRHPYLGVLVLDNINLIIEYLANIKTTAAISKFFRKIYRFLVACLENLNKVGGINKEVLNRVQILVELVCQCCLIDCYTYTMYCLLLHSHIWGGMFHQDNGTHNHYNLSICPHSCLVKCKVDTQEFLNKILTETDNWTAYRVGANAACQGEWIFSTAIFSRLIEKVKSDSCCNWLKALFQYTHSEGEIQLLRLPRQGSTLVEWLENNNFPLNSRDYLDEKDPRDAGSVNDYHYCYKLAAAHGALCSSIRILEAAVTSCQAFCFQRWYLSLRARVLENVVGILKAVRFFLSIDWNCNQVEVERNVVLGCLKSFEEISQISFQFHRLAEEFDLIGTSFIEMDSESSAVIAALALSCSLFAFASGFAVSVIHHCSHGNFTVDKSYKFLQALVMQDFIGRLWHVDHETKTKFSLMLNFIDQPTICFHLQPRYQTCNIGFEYREFLNVCRDAISGVVHFQDELRKDHNEKAPSEVTKNGLLLILNTITKWIYIPSRIPKYFFQVRQIVGSELFVNSDHTRNGVGISVFPSFNLSLNLCLQLKNLPPDFHVQLAKLYCILYCPVSCQVPSPGGQTLEQPSSVYEAWKDDEIVELNKKLFCHVSDCMTCKGRSGRRGRDDGNNKAVEAFLHFESNQKGQGFSNCILDVSDFPVGSYRIKWHSCMVDSRGSFWSLLPLNMGPVFTVQNL